MRTQGGDCKLLLPETPSLESSLQEKEAAHLELQMPPSPTTKKNDPTAMGRLSELDARHCLVMSIAFCSDELKRRDKLTQADYIDFLEAIARLSTFVSLPDGEHLKKYSCRSAMEFLDLAATGQLKEGGRETEQPTLAPRDWFKEEDMDEPLSLQLEMLITLILDRFQKEEQASGGSPAKRTERKTLLTLRRNKTREIITFLDRKDALFAPPERLETEDMIVSRMRPRRQSLQIGVSSPGKRRVSISELSKADPRKRGSLQSVGGAL